MERAQRHAARRRNAGSRWPLARTRAVAAGFAAISAVAGTPLQAAVPSLPSDCRASSLQDEVLAGVGGRGELTFASGVRAVLDGVRWPETPETAAAASTWLESQRGRTLTLVARGETDRWGRAHVDAVADAAVDLAGALVEAGLVAVDAGERDTLCRPALLAVEASARAAGRGVWREPQPEGRDATSLRARIGHFVVAHGRVLNVGERPRRTYLDFARRGEDGLTVTVSKRTWRHLQERGLSAATLKGRLVRVRGVVESWRGPTLDIASADMIEVLDEERAPRR